ncbi:hypothetical protein L7F22_037967 [Adiantum nelumboides]|nr:hypothetical protein [Adiantum nelumboides]
MTTRTIVWFRRDLRLEDNPALVAAVRAGHVLPVFIWSPEEEGQFLPGRVSTWWLKQSLIHLNESLTSLGAPLVVHRARNVLAALLEIIEATGATQVLYNHLYDPVSLVRDHRVKQGLSQAGIIVNSFNADLLYEPWEVNDDNGQAFTTFSGFWAKCMDMPAEPEAPILPPKRISKFPGLSLSCSIEELDLEDELEKGSNALLARAWAPGWANADRALESFINGSLTEYSANRQKVDSATTSLLSPHLHYGELSVRKIFHNVRMKQVLWVKEGKVEAEGSVNLFLRSIGFREYSRYLSFNFPFTHERSLLSNLKFFPWRVDESYFKAWRQGRTGYPLVDAGMRELWATGWMHNQIRVIVSSFCVKFLQLPWRWGMKYFWDTLLDADLESDVLGWQYISGSLPDGHELDRIDNPQIEGYRFDPYGEYVRRWLPELSRLPTEWIHHPWDAPPSVLRAAGIELGSNYPRPIVEIAAARERLERALAEMWANEAADKAALANGLEEGLGDTGEVQGTQDGFPTNMDIDRGPAVPGGDKTLVVRSPHDQMVPSMPAKVRRSTTWAVQGAERESAVHGVFREASASENVRAVQAQAQRSVVPPTAMQNENNDTHSTAESTSARQWSLAIGLPVWSQYVPVCPHLRQDDSQVPLVSDLHHGVLSRRHPHALPMVNFEATKTSSLSV